MLILKINLFDVEGGIRVLFLSWDEVIVLV